MNRDRLGDQRVRRLLAAALVLLALPALDARLGSASAGIGSWDAVTGYPADLDPVHLTHLPDGRFLFWGNPWVPTDSVTPCRLTDTTLVFSPPFYASSDAFCAGHTLLADSILFVAGGNEYIGCCSQGIDHLNTFDPATDTWARGPSMRWRRWYPTTTALPDGRGLITSGQFCAPCTRVIAETSEVYLPEKEQVSVLANATLPWNQFLYPFVFVLPDGKLASVGPERTTAVLDPITWSWSFLPIEQHRFSGSAAMYLPGKILKSGGTTSAACYDPPPPNPPVRPPPPTRSAVTIDFTSPSPAWMPTDSMAFARLYHNLTILPDGKVLATGGCRDSCWQDAGLPYPSCSGTVTFCKDAELYDPEAPAGQRWTTLAAMTNPAVYHTTAALLPDGRVLVATGNLPHRAEVFTPPYLEGNPPRPAVVDAPAVAHYGDTLSIVFTAASPIAKVSLLRLASVTHGFDQAQRYVPCPIVTQDFTALTAVAPLDANTAPPGFYMLFLVDTGGVPSIAKYVLVNDGHSKVFPEDFDFAVGDSVGGTLGSLFQSDNDALVAGLNGGSAAALLLSGAAPSADPALPSLTFRLESRHSLPQGTEQIIVMRDFVAAEWDTIDSRTITTTEAVTEITITSDAARYVSEQPGNEIRARVFWWGAPANSTVRVDEAIWKFPDVGSASGVGTGHGENPGWAANGTFRLLSASPNPARRGTRLRYELARDAEVRLRIVDVTGRLVTTLVNGWVGRGVRDAQWDGRASDGREVAAGAYFARMDARGASQALKITIVP